MLRRCPAPADRSAVSRTQGRLLLSPPGRTAPSAVCCIPNKRWSSYAPKERPLGCRGIQCSALPALPRAAPLRPSPPAALAPVPAPAQVLEPVPVRVPLPVQELVMVQVPLRVLELLPARVLPSGQMQQLSHRT